MAVDTVENLKSFKKAIASKRLVVVDFTATWCGPCQRIKPYFHTLSDSLCDDALFLTVDVDDAADVSEFCDIRAMPTFVCFRSGHELGRIEGANKTALKKLIDTHLE